jgi:hypothetical protein
MRDNKPCTQLVLRATDADQLAKAEAGLRAKLGALGLV